MRSKIFLIGICILGTLTIFLLIRYKMKRAVSYFNSGQLKHEVFLKDGKPEGLGIVYFESGKVQSRTYWKNGKKHGRSVVYYENGNLYQENDYKDDVCQISREYTEDGNLIEMRVYDSLGRIFDYYIYNKDGSRNFARETKDPIFIREKDTVNLGENYKAWIRLGNRQFNHVDVIIGDISDPKIVKKNLPLPKVDNLTSILSIKADSIGLRGISGVVFERSTTSDSLDLIPFTHRFYVVGRNSH